MLFLFALLVENIHGIMGYNEKNRGRLTLDYKERYKHLLNRVAGVIMLATQLFLFAYTWYEIYVPSIAKEVQGSDLLFCEGIGIQPGVVCHKVRAQPQDIPAVRMG